MTESAPKLTRPPHVRDIHAQLKTIAQRVQHLDSEIEYVNNRATWRVLRTIHLNPPTCLLCGANTLTSV